MVDLSIAMLVHQRVNDGAEFPFVAQPKFSNRLTGSHWASLHGGDLPLDIGFLQDAPHIHRAFTQAPVPDLGDFLGI